MADQLVQLLNRHGYQPVFARVGLKPPRLYTYERTGRGLAMQLRGDLSHFVPEGSRLPRPVPQALMSEISGISTSSKDVKGSLGFLRNALACIGIVNAPRLDLKFAGSGSFKFSLTDLEAVGIEPASLNDILPKLNLDTVPPKLLADGKVYIAYEYLCASTVTLERGDAKSFDTQVDVARIGEFVDVGAEGKVKVERNSRMVFQSADGKRAAFATKVGRVSEEAGKRYLVLDDGFASTEALRSPVIPVRNSVLVMLEE